MECKCQGSIKHPFPIKKYGKYGKCPIEKIIRNDLGLDKLKVSDHYPPFEIMIFMLLIMGSMSSKYLKNVKYPPKYPDIFLDFFVDIL